MSGRLRITALLFRRNAQRVGPNRKGFFMRKLVILLFMVLGVATQAQQGPSRNEIIRFLGTLHQMPGMRERLVDQGFKGENLELALGHVHTVMNDRQIAGYIADRLIALGRGDRRAAMAATGLLEPLMDRGMGHLSPRELAYFYQVEKTVIDAMPLRTCGLAFKDKLAPGEMEKSTARVAARLNTPALKEYYRIQLKAAKLGVNRKAKQLTGARKARAEQALVESVIAISSARGDGQRLLAAMDDMDGASNAMACKAGRMFLDGVMSLPAGKRHDALVLMTGL